MAGWGSERAGPRAGARDAAGRPEDEISLYQLWAVIVRRRRALVLIWMTVAALGVAYGVLKPPVYRYSTVLELGTYSEEDTTGTRTIHYLREPEAVRHRLREVYIPAALDEMEDAAPPRVRVEHNDSSELVLLRSESSLDGQDRVRDVHRSAARQLLADHGTQAAHETQLRQLQLDQAQRRLDHATDPRIQEARLEPARKRVAEAEQALESLEEDYRIEKLGLENTIEAKSRQLTKLEEERQQLGNSRERLKTLEELLEQQVGESKQLTGALEQRRTGLEEAAGAAPDAFGLLLLTVQLEQAKRRLAELRERLAVGLPQQADELTARLAENERLFSTTQEKLDELRARLAHTIATHEAEQKRLARELEAARTNLAETTARYEQDVASARHQVAAAKLALDQVAPTRLVVAGQRSARPVSAGPLVTSALAVVLGLMLGVLATFVVEFLARARRYADAGSTPEPGALEEETSGPGEPAPRPEEGQLAAFPRHAP